MKVKVNGENIEIDKAITLVDLLQKYDLHPDAIAVEINYEIIPRFRFAETKIKENDSIEIVHFVGGG